MLLYILYTQIFYFHSSNWEPIAYSLSLEDALTQKDLYISLHRERNAIEGPWHTINESSFKIYSTPLNKLLKEPSSVCTRFKDNFCISCPSHCPKDKNKCEKANSFKAELVWEGKND